MSLEKAVENISIHAPTRGATIVTKTTGADRPISIHAPTRGATTNVRGRIGIAQFQSTLPRGERLAYDDFSYVGYVFQSTLPRGERQVLPDHIRPDIVYFNPRSHEGSDGKTYSALCGAIDFNPRSHEGSDQP